MALAINFKEWKTNAILSLIKINSKGKQQILNKKKTYVYVWIYIKEFVFLS